MLSLCRRYPSVTVKVKVLCVAGVIATARRNRLRPALFESLLLQPDNSASILSSSTKSHGIQLQGSTSASSAGDKQGTVAPSTSAQLSLRTNYSIVVVDVDNIYKLTVCLLNSIFEKYL